MKNSLFLFQIWVGVDAKQDITDFRFVYGFMGFSIFNTFLLFNPVPNLIGKIFYTQIIYKMGV